MTAVATRSPFTAEELEPTLRPLLEASMLPTRAFTDDDVAAWEAANLFLGGWICVGHVSALEGRGRFITAEVAGESLLFVDGRGFHNVCRHRGARLITLGATASTARCATRRTPTPSRTSTPRATG
jgi:choline monooxygenase